MRARRAPLVLLLTLAGCGIDTLVLARLDAGEADTAPLPPEDASIVEDAALERDGGVEDASTWFDAAPVFDASLDADALAPADGNMGGLTCFESTDCAPESYCEKPTCDAPFGLCTPRRLLCDDQPQPVCGCNGVTYYNDCTRRSDGASLASPTECFVGMTTCDSTTPCPNGGYCAFLSFTDMSCTSPAVGTCWILPAECVPNRFGGDRFAPCNAPNSCVDACTAIKSGLPHVLQRRCVDLPGGVTF